MISVSPFLIIVFYGVSIAALVFSHKRSLVSLENTLSETSPLESNSFFLNLAFWITLLIGIVLHFTYAASVSYVQHSFNFSVASMSFWISVLVVSAFAIGSIIYPIKNLAVIVLPLAILSILFALAWGDQQQLIDQRDNTFYWHIGSAISAFTLLSLSVLQALLFGYQELILLSIAISLGSIYNYELNQTMFSFNHHTVLAIMSWLGFAILLYGRIKLGWRGLQAINWQLGAVSL